MPWAWIPFTEVSMVARLVRVSIWPNIPMDSGSNRCWRLASKYSCLANLKLVWTAGVSTNLMFLYLPSEMLLLMLCKAEPQLLFKNGDCGLNHRLFCGDVDAVLLKHLAYIASRFHPGHPTSGLCSTRTWHASPLASAHPLLASCSSSRQRAG